MDTGKAIFLGLALIALAIFATDALRPANAGIRGGGQNMGTADSNFFVWVVDTETGKVRQCFLTSKRETPNCYSWSKGWQ